MSGGVAAFAVYVFSGLWYVVFSVMANRAYLPSSMIWLKRIFGIKDIYRYSIKSIFMQLAGL